jgi:hypothetical protein
MYVTYSPCAKCSSEIGKFADEENVQVEVRFSSVFQHYDKDTMQKLRELNDNSRVSVSVFTEEDWSKLEEYLVSYTVIYIYDYTIIFQDV